MLFAVPHHWGTCLRRVRGRKQDDIVNKRARERQEVWQCGTGRAVINPQKGHCLAGYGVDYPNEGVHDDLCVTALYLSDGERQALLLNFDLIALPGPLNRRLRRAAAAAAGIPAEHVFLAATHTHSGPEVRQSYLTLGRIPTWRRDYNTRLARWAAEAAAEARRTAEPCQLLYNLAEAAENMNRQFRFPDRRHLYVPDHKQVAGLSDEFVDRKFALVAFRRSGTPNRYKAVVTNYAAHPLCVGNSANLVSADYPGELRRVVEETFAGCRCLSTTGAAGDQHPLFPEGGFEAARRMGGALGRLAVARAYDAVPARYDTRLRMAWRDVTLRVKDDATRRMLPDLSHRQMSLGMMEGRRTLRTSVNVLGIGPVLFAGMPGEVVGELGAMLKWSSPFLVTCALFQATDDIGYLVTRNQFLWGGMEAASTPLAAGEAERLVATAVDAAGALLRKHPIDYPTLV